MNQVPGQGMGGRPNGQNPQIAAAPQRPQGAIPLYRPEMMRNITFLAEDEKTKYERGLQGLWKIHDTAPAGSPEQLEAKRKLTEFGKILHAKVQQRRQQAQAQQQQQGQQAQGHPQQTQQTQAQQVQAQQQLQQNHHNQQQQHQQQQQQQQQHQQQQLLQQRQQQPLQPAGQVQAPQQAQRPLPPQGSLGQAGNMGNPPPQQSAAGQQASPNSMAAGAQQQQGARSFPHIVAHVNEMQFQAPSTVPDKAKWVEEIKQKYAKAIYSMETARSTIKSIEQTVAENQSLPPDERKKLEDRKAMLHKQYTDAIAFANLVRKNYGVGGGNQRVVQNGGGPGPNPGNQARPSGVQATAQPGPGANNGAPTAGPVSTMQSSTATVNAAFEAAKKQQLAAGRMPGSVGALPAQPQGPPSQQPLLPQQAQVSATPAHAQQSPVTQNLQTQPQISQQQPQQPQQIQQPAPIKIEPGTQPHPTPLNTAMAAASAGGMPLTGTPTQNSARLQTPQSATPTTANANIRPLTHAAAVNLASQPRAPSVQLPPAAGPGVAPTSNMGVMGVQQQQQQGHPHAHPPAPQNLQSKLPIPKVLPEKATQMPTAVPNIGGIGSGRPTYSGGGGIGGGVMNQPALPKTPAFQLEGEGERILNKKKLDELVRQVCGGTPEGQEGNLLTPEVEEVSNISFLHHTLFHKLLTQTQSVLNMADSFVDSVLHQACRNSKERGSKVLEIRDLQLVLERTYNIRIPGYSSEELRTVRKVQPNSSWIKKMSAVQAAKVVPGKGDL
ncbi:Transcription initiation factor TFIID subunit 12 [Collariella sp. IMI 366227]|nr:Transcription initiation factor TFIID subunit 12 [Collariella sp. IMI 366227]